MKKIILLNQGHTPNFGDIAINNTLGSCLKQYGIEVVFVPLWSASKVFRGLSKYGVFISICHRLPFITDLFYERYIRHSIVFADIDAIVIGGGELIGGHYGFHSALYVICMIAKKNNIPVYVYGVSGSQKQLKNQYIKRNIKSFAVVKKAYVRDAVSLDLVKNVYKYSNCECYPDVVFSYRIVFQKATPIENKRDILVVPISFISQVKEGMGFNDIDIYCDYLSGIISSNNPDGSRIVITPSCKDDEDFCEYLLQFLTDTIGWNNVFYYQYSTFDHFINHLNNSRLVISGRMHAMILGLVFGCSVLPLEFKDKLICFKHTIVDCYDDSIPEKSYLGISELAKMILDN